MIPFVTPRTSLNRGSLNRGSTQYKVKDYDEDVFDLDIKIPQDCWATSYSHYCSVVLTTYKPLRNENNFSFFFKTCLQ